MGLIDDIKRDQVAGTPGPFAKTSDHDWSLDTGWENAYYVIKGAYGPFAVVAVEAAFELDNRNEADMRRVCRLDALEQAYLDLAEAADALAKAGAWMGEMIDEGVVQIRPPDREEFLNWLNAHNTALSAYRKARLATQ